MSEAQPKAQPKAQPEAQTAPPSFSELLDLYESGIEHIETSAALEIETVFVTMTTRDRLQSIVRRKKQLEKELFARLCRLDKRLESCADTLTDYNFLKKLCRSYRPSRSAWWWYLDAKNSPLMRSNRFGWVWGAATVVNLLFSATFMTQTARAFSSQGFDFLGTLSTIGQGVGFALVASGAATQTGRDTLDVILKSLRVPGHRTAEATFGLSAGLLLVSYGLNTNLYRLGDYYYDRGLEFEAEQSWSQALASYRRAEQFDPSPELLLREGGVYEVLGRYDEAIETYSFGAAGDPYFLQASARASLLRELNQSGWRGGLPQEQLNQALANLQRARLHPNSGRDPELLRQIYLTLGLVELSRLNFDEPIADEDKSMLATAEEFFDVAFQRELEIEAPEDGVFRWKDLRAQCYRAMSRFVNVLLDVPAEDGSVVYLQGADPRLQHADVWYSCNEIFIEENDFEVATDVLLLQTVLSARSIAPAWRSTTQGFPSATIADRARLDSLASELSDGLEVDAAAIDFTDRASAIVRLAVDGEGNIIDYYTYDTWALAVARNTSIYGLWEEHVPIVAANLSSGDGIEVADLKLEIFPDGRTEVTPWGMAYQVDTIPLEPLGAAGDVEIGISRREVLRSLLAVQLRDAFLNVRAPASSFNRKLQYRVTVAADGRVLDYEPLDDVEREQLNKTPLPYLEKAAAGDGGATQEFLVQFKSSYAFQIPIVDGEF